MARSDVDPASVMLVRCTKVGVVCPVASGKSGWPQRRPNAANAANAAPTPPGPRIPDPESRQKQWPLHGVQVSLSYARVHAEDCAECETKGEMVDRIELGISFTGDLSQEQQRRLLDIANKCPVHRTLVSRVEIDTRLIVDGSPSP